MNREKSKKNEKNMTTEKFIFIQDDDNHWYLIRESQKALFYDWADFCENGGDYDNIDFDAYMIDNPSDYYFSNPIKCS